MGEIAEQFLDDMLFGTRDRFGADLDDDHETEVVCRYCGKAGLVWEEVRGNWRLFEPESKQKHTCPEAIRAHNPHKDVKIELKIP